MRKAKKKQRLTEMNVCKGARRELFCLGGFLFVCFTLMTAVV